MTLERVFLSTFMNYRTERPLPRITAPGVRLQFWQRHLIQWPRRIRVENFDDLKPFTAIFTISFCACAQSPFCRNRHSQRHRFHNKGMDILRFDNVIDILAIFLLRMRKNSHFWACGYNFDNTIGFSNPDFLQAAEIWQSESVYGRFRLLFFAHAQNRHYLCFRSEICYHRRS